MIYQATGKVISTDPAGRQSDTTTWEHDLATGLKLPETYTDDKEVVRTYANGKVDGQIRKHNGRD